MPIPQRTTVCILTKSPIAGEVKTRLVPAFGESASRDLACAFLVDTVNACRQLTWARVVVATTLPVAEEVLEAAAGLEIWDQGSGDLGARIERVLRRALQSSAAAILIGADSPGLPRDRLDSALEKLESVDAVIGPAEDGGFYLLGLTRCRDDLLSNIPWSSAETCERTASRLRDCGYSAAFLEPWFDVDRAEDVYRLGELLRAGEISASITSLALERILKNRRVQET